MSDILAKKIKNELGNMEALQLTIPIGRLAEFKSVLNRALNTWDTAPSEWKELADILEHGIALQDYYAQGVAKNVPGAKRNKHGV